MEKYRIVSSDTLDGLVDEINRVANDGYVLSEFRQSASPDENWQGVAIMEREIKEGTSESALNTPVAKPRLSHAMISKKAQERAEEYELTDNGDYNNRIRSCASSSFYAGYVLAFK